MAQHSQFEGLESLAETLRRNYPYSVVQFDAWGTGRFGTPQACLYVAADEHQYAVEYDFGVGFGVTQVTDDNTLLRGWDAKFTTLEEAQTYLLAQLPRPKNDE